MYYNVETDREASASTWCAELGGDNFYKAVKDGVLIPVEEYYG